MFDKLGKIGGAVNATMDMLKQQEKMKAIQVIGESKDHLVKVHLNGLFEMVNVVIDEVLLDPGKSRNLKSAIIEAYKSARQKLESEMAKNTDISDLRKKLGL